MHVAHEQHACASGSRVHVQPPLYFWQMQPRPQHPGQFFAPPHNGSGPAVSFRILEMPSPPKKLALNLVLALRAQAAAQILQRGWKCPHCTFLNMNAPILDPHTKQHKGFCEICEGVTTLFGTS